MRSRTAGAGYDSVDRGTAAHRAPPPVSTVRRDDDAAHGLRRYAPGRDAARGQSSEPVCGDDNLVQSRAGQVAERRDGGDSARVAGDPPAGAISPEASPARRSNIEKSLGDGAASRGGGGRRDLHRARHPVRELHPSDHDPVHAAVGGLGAVARALHVRHPVHDHRAYRGDPVDRHREEERDHDDRLRSPGRARGRADEPRGDFPARR